MDFGNDWTELCVSVQTDDAEKAENIAQMATPYGIYIEDYSNLEEEAGAIAHIEVQTEFSNKKLVEAKIKYSDINSAKLKVFYKVTVKNVGKA